ncbi:MAG TPA: family 16 glycoside hydrolase [Roseiflexaceae bacterium]|nr:family 16 glycoside hydrolase [Roseiflexaceae bacterium]
MLARNGDGACSWSELVSQPYSLNPNTWYAIRAEARGSHLKLSIEGKTVFEYDDPKLASGFFYLIVNNGATVRFADIRVVPTE